MPVAGDMALCSGLSLQPGTPFDAIKSLLLALIYMSFKMLNIVRKCKVCLTSGNYWLTQNLKINNFSTSTSNPMATITFSTCLYTHTYSPHPHTTHTSLSHLTVVLSLRLSLMILCTNSTSPPAVMVSHTSPVLTVDGTGLLPERATPPYLSSPSPKKGGLHMQKWYC